MREIKITIDETTYKSVPEPQTRGCEGCVAHENLVLCQKLNDVDCCVKNRCIWEKENNMNLSTDEFVKCAVDYFWDNLPYNTREGAESDLKNFILNVENRKKIKEDPEYQTYLKLKDKFGDIE